MRRKVSAGAKRDGDKTFISSCLQNANWLTKSLEQRVRTILKVASEIVRLQDAFLAKGVEHLRPAQSAHHRRRHRHARVDGLARHLQQIYDDAARHLRAQIFLLRLHRDDQRRRGAFGGSGALQDQADDRQGERPTTFCPTTPSSRGSRRSTSTSPGAPSPNIATACAFPPRWTAAARKMALSREGPAGALSGKP